MHHWGCRHCQVFPCVPVCQMFHPPRLHGRYVCVFLLQTPRQGSLCLSESLWWHQQFFEFLQPPLWLQKKSRVFKPSLGVQWDPGCDKALKMVPKKIKRCGTLPMGLADSLNGGSKMPFPKSWPTLTGSYSTYSVSFKRKYIRVCDINKYNYGFESLCYLGQLQEAWCYSLDM